MSRLFCTLCVVTLFTVACGDNYRPGAPADTNLCAAVTCLAADACHEPGVCDEATGLCSNPAMADGTVCNDDNACSTGDTCSAGVCGGGTHVTCTALDSCHDVGTCDGATGLCSNPVKADGAACSDGNACSTGETCSAGVCGGGTAVTCAAADSCHDAGTCDATTGLCSNPVKADGATCNDGNACSSNDICSAGICGGTPYTCPSPAAPDDCHVGVCNGDGTCSVGNAPDGMTCCGPIPAGHCGAPFNGSCAAGTCGNINACGDGAVELTLGESCDDSNTINGDGCDATCHVESFQTTAPVKISGALSCTTTPANAAHKIALDGNGTIFAVMKCGTSADVAVSTDRGRSFSDPLDLSEGLPPTIGIFDVSVAAGPSGVAYIAILMNNGQVFLRTTQDRGATWAAPVAIGAASKPAGLAVQSFNDDVYIGFASGTGVAVASNHSKGIGAFQITQVALTVTFFDLVFDVRLGTLAVCTDSPTFHMRVSSDAGVTFASEVNPAGSEFFSDWAIGNGTIFVSGTNNGASGNSTRLFLIPSSAPTTSSSVAGLPTVSTAQSRSVAADDAGNAFVASQLNAGGAQLDRLPAGAAAFDASRNLDPAGTSPVVASLPGNLGAAVVYTIGTEVWATIQAY